MMNSMLKLAVIGDPIEHSLSPLVHGAALDALGVEYEYKKVRVKCGELGDFIEYAKECKIDGFNLTMPHKTDIIPFLFDIDKEAEVFSSVNTVCIKDGRLYGYNTDAAGYRMSLEKCGYSFKNSKIVILGAGGVVRTLSKAAAVDGAESITILNRSKQKAEEICKSIDGLCLKTDFGGFSADEIAKRCEGADILINATPLGMSGVESNFEDLSFLNALPKTALVSDLIYNPPMTEFLKEAKKRGNKILNGLSMLIYQALAADEHYLERKINMQSVYEKVKTNILR